ncbi:patatin-like phospholipase family protein [Salinibacter grassmerensis]|uniref:patatin-like phospholipase family protein n=1 Tax=Salinibacter grassmerensis TaxID=3040353 RepID=UPI0021E737A4|nr:patatin-like phospholipase family protein [Salinibacter grassmerensis]
MSGESADGTVESDSGGPAEAPAALVLGGGGARAAYQTGVLHYVGEAFPEASVPLMTGVSAGSINAAHLAADPGPWKDRTARLVRYWEDLTADDVFAPRSPWTIARSMLWGRRPSKRQTLLDTAPLRAYLDRRLPTDDTGRLTGVADNIEAGRLEGLAISTSNYATLQTVTWVQGGSMRDWERPNRIGRRTILSLDHVMASTALPMVFPAVRLGDAWYGDGGLRMLDPLAPAVHLGADRLFVVSTRYERSQAEANRSARTPAYPSLFQMMGILANVLMLDVLEHDAAVLRRINRLVRKLRPEEHEPLQPIDLLVLRPSVDLGALAGDYQMDLGGAMGRLLSAVQWRTDPPPDWWSMLLFQPDYLDRLLEIGYNDAQRQHDRIEAFFAREPIDQSASVSFRS